jgi:Domain of unknown function (DUF6249)
LKIIESKKAAQRIQFMRQLKRNLSIMKNIWKILLIVPLILAVAMAPLRADETNAADTKTNTAAIAAPPPPAAPEPPAPSSPDHPVVGVDSSGIYVGGPNPVHVNMPNFSDARIGGDGITLIALVSVVAPFFFVFLIIAAFLFARYRRNRMLHETLRVMIEKGVPIPPELIMPQGRSVRRGTRCDLRYGLIMIGLGVGLLVLSLRIAWIALFIGAAFLLTWLIERKDTSLNEPITK